MFPHTKTEGKNMSPFSNEQFVWLDSDLTTLVLNLLNSLLDNSVLLTVNCLLLKKTLTDVSLNHTLYRQKFVDT